jgi:hypothetical protein
MDEKYARDNADPHCPHCGGMGMISDETSVPYSLSMVTLKEFEICDCVLLDKVEEEE